MRVAVTGGIAEGKSTVMGYLRSLGQSTASADEFAREVFQLDEVQEAISQRLGLKHHAPREEVRSAISGNPEIRRWLNTITHPRIFERIENSRADWIEVPLLFEACLQGSFDSIWVVTCGEIEQLSRLAARLGDEAAARKMMGTQLSTSIKIAFADEIIRTNLSETTVKSLVRQGIERESTK